MLQSQSPPDLPPGVMAFLLSDCKYVPDVVSRVLLELAAEGVVLMSPDPGGTPLAGPGAAEPRSGRSLLPFEQAMLGRVMARARRGPVPLPVLLSDDGDDYASWRKRLTDELGAEAKRAGLASRRTARGAWLPVAVALTGTLIATLAGFSIRPADGRTALGVGCYVSFFSLLVPAFSRRWRLTQDGTEAVAWWRRNGGAAADLPGAWPTDGAAADLPGAWPTGGAAADLPAAAGLRWPAGRPVPRGHAWSSLGGHWHPVRVGPQPRPARWSTARTLAALMFYTVVGTVIAGAIGILGMQGDPLGKLIAITPAAAGAAVILGLWLPSYTRRMRLPDGVTFTGEVIKRWKVEDSEGPDSFLCCIDDGRSPAAPTFNVGAPRYEQLQVGELARVTFSPRRQRLLDIEPAADSPPLTPPPTSPPGPDEGTWPATRDGVTRPAPADGVTRPLA